MNTFSQLLVGLIVLAIVAVVVASPKTSGAIAAVGQAIAALAGNVVGTGAKAS